MKTSSTILFESGAQQARFAQAATAQVVSDLVPLDSLVRAPIPSSGLPDVCVLQSAESLPRLATFLEPDRSCVVVVAERGGWSLGPIFSRDALACPLCWHAHLKSLGMTAIGSRRDIASEGADDAAALSAALKAITPVLEKQMLEGRRYRGCQDRIEESDYLDTVHRQPYCARCSSYQRNASERYLEVL